MSNTPNLGYVMTCEPNKQQGKTSFPSSSIMPPKSATEQLTEAQVKRDQMNHELEEAQREVEQEETERKQRELEKRREEAAKAKRKAEAERKRREAEEAERKKAAAAA